MPETSFAVLENLQFEYQRLLSETAHLLLRDGDADELCQMIFEVLREPLKLDVYFHYLVSEDHTHLQLASSGGNDTVRKALGTPLQFGQAVCGTVAERCEWMYVPGVQDRHDEMTSLIRSFGIRCYACQPLIGRGEMLGTFSFGSSRRDEFTPEELEFFRLMAQQIALATERRIHNRYVRQLEHQAAAGRMCATLAHEINNPLETLTNVLYLFRNEALSEDGQRMLRAAENEVARLGETTQRTLDLFRGRQPHPQPLDLSDLLQDVVTQLHVPKNVPIQTDVTMGLLVHAVPGEMRQVFLNLLLNAAQFSPPDKAVALKAHQQNGHVEVRVEDQGPGISEKARAKLFQPFYTTRGEGGGNGLGLWVSQEIIGRSGGTLTFESDPMVRAGTTFVVSLPAVAI